MSRRVLNPKWFIWIGLAAMLSPVVSQAQIEFLPNAGGTKIIQSEKIARYCSWVQTSQGPILHCSGMQRLPRRSGEIGDRATPNGLKISN